MVARFRTTPTKSTRFVLDESVALAWFFADESHAYADSVANDLAFTQAIVPAIWPRHIANALVAGERRKQNSAAQSTVFLARLADLTVSIDPRTSSMDQGPIINLARAERLSVDDAAYLELAMHENIPLATLDDPLKTAASRVGVILHQVRAK